MTGAFRKNIIKNNFEIIAGELIRTREGAEISLEKVSERLNIKVDYLRMMEKGDFRKLPSGVYARNYLKDYAKFLQLNADEMLKIFDKEMDGNDEHEDLFAKQVVKNWYFIAVPKIFKNIMILLSVGVCLGYLGLSLNKIKEPARLEIFFPPDNLTTNDNQVNISGIADPGTKININGEPALTNVEGIFNMPVNLRKGFNTIMIIAEKNYGVKNIITRQILVKN
jgi:hypothetical protein